MIWIRRRVQIRFYFHHDPVLCTPPPDWSSLFRSASLFCCQCVFFFLLVSSVFAFLSCVFLVLFLLRSWSLRCCELFCLVNYLHPSWEVRVWQLSALRVRECVCVHVGFCMVKEELVRLYCKASLMWQHVDMMASLLFRQCCCRLFSLPLTPPPTHTEWGVSHCTHLLLSLSVEVVLLWSQQQHWLKGMMPVVKAAVFIRLKEDKNVSHCSRMLLPGALFPLYFDFLSFKYSSYCLIYLVGDAADWFRFQCDCVCVHVCVPAC